MVRFTQFFVLFCLCSQAALATTEAQFRAALRTALQNTALSPVEKVQHTLDRLGYGPHPTILPHSRLLKFTTAGAMDEMATDNAIINYVVESLKPGYLNHPQAAPVIARYPNALLAYEEVSDAYRRFRDQRKRLLDRIERLEEARPVDQTALDTAKTALQNVKIASVKFQKSLLKAEQVRFLSHGVLESQPLYLKLLYVWFNRFNISWDRATYDLGDYLRAINASRLVTFTTSYRQVRTTPA